MTSLLNDVVIVDTAGRPGRTGSAGGGSQALAHIQNDHEIMNFDDKRSAVVLSEVTPHNLDHKLQLKGSNLK